MPLAQLPEAFNHDDWVFEIKYDGWRALAFVDDGNVRLVSRKNHMYKSFPDLCITMADCLKIKNAVLDGEIVFLGDDGRPQFYELMRRRKPQHYAAFDVLWLDGKD